MNRLSHKKLDKIYHKLSKNYESLYFKEVSNNDYLELIKDFISEYKKLKTDKKYIIPNGHLWYLRRIIELKDDLGKKKYEQACHHLMAFIRDNKETILQKRIFYNIINIKFNE